MENISHSIFLSSSYEEFVGEERIENPTRASMLELAPTLPVALVTVEKLRASLYGVEMVLDACTTAIKECTIFVLLVGTNHGSGVMLASGTAISSYLEMEIFTAAIQGKPILVLHLEGVEPHPQLKELLDRFRTSFSSEEYFTGNRKQLRSKLVEVAKLVASQGQIQRNKQLTSLPDFLASRRSHSKSSTELSDPKLRFLDNQPLPQGVSTSERKSALIASEVLQGQILKHGSPQLMTQGGALFRIWAAMRELGGALGPNLEDSKVIPEWDNLLVFRV